MKSWESNTLQNCVFALCVTAIILVAMIRGCS